MKLVNEKLDYGKFWHPNQVVIFTANSTLTKDGRLVMGAGAAKECRDAFIGIDKEFGSRIKRIRDLYKTYNFCYMEILFKSQYEKWTRVGAFQTKCDWRNTSPTDLIYESTKQLINTSKCNPTKEFHMNFPGINYGGLSVESVTPIIEELPDNVFVYKV